jgi:hypothetical protein
VCGCVVPVCFFRSAVAQQTVFDFVDFLFIGTPVGKNAVLSRREDIAVRKIIFGFFTVGRQFPDKNRREKGIQKLQLGKLSGDSVADLDNAAQFKIFFDEIN